MADAVGKGPVAGDVLGVLPGYAFVADLRDPDLQLAGYPGQRGDAGAVSGAVIF